MCVLHVTSLTKSFAAIMTGSELPIYKSHEKGEMHEMRADNIYTDFGFSCDVSDCDWDDLPGQFSDASRFLKRHQLEILRIISGGEVDDIRLDFPYFNRGQFCQCDYLPPKLLKRAGDLGIGIELSLYPSRTPLIGEDMNDAPASPL